MTCWTVAASTGTVDEGSRDFIILGRRPQAATTIGSGSSPAPFSSSNIFGREDAVVSLRPTAPKGAYSIRYHVPPEPIEKPEDFNTLGVRYLVDDANLGRVVVMLKKYSLSAPPAGEIAQIVAVFDSNEHPESPEFQRHSARFDDDLNEPDFAYFIEALLISDREPPPLPSVELPGAPLRGPALAAIEICTVIT